MDFVLHRDFFRFTEGDIQEAIHGRGGVADLATSFDPQGSATTVSRDIFHKPGRMPSAWAMMARANMPMAMSVSRMKMTPIRRFDDRAY